jgi:hypothetical protein
MNSKPSKRSRWTKPRRFRDREDEGSNPSPPTIFVFKIDEFRVTLESAAHSRITISYEPPNRGCANGVDVGQCEIAGQRPLATQRPEPADAQGRTVRLGVQIPGPDICIQNRRLQRLWVASYRGRGHKFRKQWKQKIPMSRSHRDRLSRVEISRSLLACRSEPSRACD